MSSHKPFQAAWVPNSGSNGWTLPGRDATLGSLSRSGVADGRAGDTENPLAKALVHVGIGGEDGDRGGRPGSRPSAQRPEPGDPRRVRAAQPASPDVAQQIWSLSQHAPGADDG